MGPGSVGREARCLGPHREQSPVCKPPLSPKVLPLPVPLGTWVGGRVSGGSLEGGGGEVGVGGCQRNEKVVYPGGLRLRAPAEGLPRIIKQGHPSESFLVLGPALPCVAETHEQPVAQMNGSATERCYAL